MVSERLLNPTRDAVTAILEGPGQVESGSLQR